MEAFSAAIIACGPLFLLGFATSFVLLFLRWVIPAASTRSRLIVYLIALIPPLLHVFSISVRTVAEQGTIIPTWIGAAFFAIGALVGMGVRDSWRP